MPSPCAHFCSKWCIVVYWDWCIVGFVKLFYSCIFFEENVSYTMKHVGLYQFLTHYNNLFPQFPVHCIYHPRVFTSRVCPHLAHCYINNSHPFWQGLSSAHTCSRAAHQSNKVNARASKAGVGVTESISCPRHFTPLLRNWNYYSYFWYHFHIWQMSPQLSRGDTCQIWM